VSYPEEMTVPIDNSASFNAALDVGTEPLPADERIEVEDGEATSEVVLVKCTVAARLTSVGEALSIADHLSATGNGWVVQDFSPTGVIEWAWTVTAHKPVEQELLLELRPAIVVDADAGDMEYASRNMATFTTEVAVDASPMHHTAYWFEVNWPLIAIVATALGTGTLAVVGWYRKLRTSAASKPSAGKQPHEE